MRRTAARQARRTFKALITGLTIALLINLVIFVVWRKMEHDDLQSEIRRGHQLHLKQLGAMDREQEERMRRIDHLMRSTAAQP